MIEPQYLSPAHSPLFKKIQQIYSIIFTFDNTAYSCGPAGKELKEFMSFNWFTDHLTEIEQRDLPWEHNPIQKCGLQKLIEDKFKQRLDKTATLAERGCGLDLFLATQLSENIVGSERTYWINEEKKYAENDVFVVTFLFR